MDKKALWISTTRKNYWANKEIPYITEEDKNKDIIDF